MKSVIATTTPILEISKTTYIPPPSPLVRPPTMLAVAGGGGAREGGNPGIHFPCIKDI